MKSFLVFMLLFGLSIASDVLELNDSDFASAVAKEDIILVEFFAPWSGHCKRLAPEYETAATTLKSSDPPVPLAKVDCTESGKDTCSRYGVAGYPTLKIFRNGEMAADYDGPMDANGIAEFMKKAAGPAAKEVSDSGEMYKLLDHSDLNIRIVGFFSDKDSAESKEFLKAASTLRDLYSFLYTTNPDVMIEYGYRDKIVIFRAPVLANKFDAGEVVFGGEITTGALSTWIKENEFGLVGVMTHENEDRFPKPLVVVYYNIDVKRNLKGFKYWRGRVIRVAKQFLDKDVNFAVANNQDFSRRLIDLGFNTDDEDTLFVVARDVAGYVFVMTDKFDIETFAQFVTDFIEGDLKPYVKSEPLPETNDDPVKVVVGKSFEEIVLDPTKDVLIEFYAPWNGHCKALAPIYEELGEKFKDDPNIVIAKMDATANHAPADFDISGFPTIYWVPRDQKANPQKYEGVQELNEFISFIKSHTTFATVNIQEREIELLARILSLL